jgi:hypothetical protein
VRGICDVGKLAQTIIPAGRDEGEPSICIRQACIFCFHAFGFDVRPEMKFSREQAPGHPQNLVLILPTAHGRFHSIQGFQCPDTGMSHKR